MCGIAKMITLFVNLKLIDLSNDDEGQKNDNKYVIIHEISRKHGMKLIY